MIRKKVAAAAFGAALGLGTIAATAIPAVASSSSTETRTTVPGGGTTTITLPGIGDLTLTVDPTTGAISNVSLTNLDPSVANAADPVVQPDGGVQIALTMQDGTQQTLDVSSGRRRVTARATRRPPRARHPRRVRRTATTERRSRTAHPPSTTSPPAAKCRRRLTSGPGRARAR
jgi:hypothetical protein